jgi:hypothetical protein
MKRILIGILVAIGCLVLLFVLFVVYCSLTSIAAQISEIQVGDKFIPGQSSLGTPKRVQVHGNNVREFYFERNVGFWYEQARIYVDSNDHVIEVYYDDF